MADRRLISTGFWTDEYTQSLPKDFKFLYIYLMTNRETQLCGLYNITVKTIMNDTELPKETIEEALERFREDKKVFFDSNLIFIKNYAKHQNGERFGYFPEHVYNSYKLHIKNNNIAYQEFKSQYFDIIDAFEIGLANPLQKGTRNRNRNKIKEKDKEIKKPDDKKESFEKFWELYGKKVGDKSKLFKKWAAIPQEEIEKIFKHVPEYIKSQPDKTFRKNPETYLNNKSWNDELIFSPSASAPPPAPSVPRKDPLQTAYNIFHSLDISKLNLEGDLYKLSDTVLLAKSSELDGLSHTDRQIVREHLENYFWQIKNKEK